MSTPEALVRWYGLLLLLTVAFAPLVRLLCSRLPDRGATIARPIGMLGMVAPVWFLAGFGLIPFSAAGLWATIAIVAVVGWALVIRGHLVDTGWLRALAFSEVLAILVFLAYVGLRGYTPNIDNTEKPMDMAFLSASERTETIPPNDPWYSGETINYYYMGYLVYGSVSRLAGVPTEIGFNLALVTTGSAAIVAAGGLGFNIVRRRGPRSLAIATGAFAAFLIVVAGNMLAPMRFLEHGSATVDARWWDQAIGIGWRSSRIICDGVRVDGQCDTGGGAVETITEFPSFSLLFGDLHPHVMALPFTIVALALALGLLLSRDDGRDESLRWVLVRAGATGMLIGSLYALNSWDYPTYLLAGLVAGAVGFWHRSLRERLLASVIYLGASFVAWLPFYLHFTAPVGQSGDQLPELLRNVPLLSTVLRTVTAVRGDRTSATEFLTMFGLPYIVAIALLVTGLWRGAAERPHGDAESRHDRSLPGLIGQTWPVLLVIVIIGVVLPAPVLILAGIPALLLGCQSALAQPEQRGTREIAAALFSLGLVLVVGADLFYIQDSFATRMNTVFKTYYQAWTLFGVAAAVSATAMWAEIGSRKWRVPTFGSAAIVAVLLGLAYPVIAYNQWTEQYRYWQSLDGLAYIADASPDELAAIEWVSGHLGPDDVILEAAGCSYGNSYSLSEVRHNRVAAFTGVPTVIGWGGHEGQWRRGQPEYDTLRSRADDVRAMYEDPRSTLFDTYGVDYLYVGTLEQRGDRDCSLLAEPYAGVDSPAYPGAGWALAFESGDVRVFKRDVS